MHNKKLKIDIARKKITFIQCDERHEIFAPSWDLLLDYKNGHIDWSEYVVRYYDEMRQAYKSNSAIFHRFAKMLDNVEFLCWCNLKRSIKNRCHRFLLMDILKKIRTSL